MLLLSNAVLQTAPVVHAALAPRHLLHLDPRSLPSTLALPPPVLKILDPNAPTAATLAGMGLLPPGGSAQDSDCSRQVALSMVTTTTPTHFDAGGIVGGWIDGAFPAVHATARGCDQHRGAGKAAQAAIRLAAAALPGVARNESTATEDLARLSVQLQQQVDSLLTKADSLGSGSLSPSGDLSACISSKGSVTAIPILVPLQASGQQAEALQALGAGKRIVGYCVSTTESERSAPSAFSSSAECGRRRGHSPEALASLDARGGSIADSRYRTCGVSAWALAVRDSSGAASRFAEVVALARRGVPLAYASARAETTLLWCQHPEEVREGAARVATIGVAVIAAYCALVVAGLAVPLFLAWAHWFASACIETQQARAEGRIWALQLRPQAESEAAI